MRINHFVKDNEWGPVLQGETCFAAVIITAVYVDLATQSTAVWSTDQATPEMGY